MIPWKRPVPMPESDPRVPLNVPKAGRSNVLNVEFGGLESLAGTRQGERL
jgi:hypothetical protein